MAVRSVYLAAPSIDNDRLSITGDEHHHLMVARTTPGEVIEIFDGRGSAWTGVVDSVGKRETVVRVVERRKIQADPLELIAGLALTRIAAFELALEKVAEIGVTRIVPFRANRSNVVPGDRHERWTRILTEAAKQSKQYYLPGLDQSMDFGHLISMPAKTKIMFAERDGGSLKSALAGSPVLFLIGPEGGWTDAEISAARTSGFEAVSLGATILKAETAAIAGAALIRYEFGR